MVTRESSQTKTRQRGGAFEGEIEEKGLDGKDRKRGGIQTADKETHQEHER